MKLDLVKVFLHETLARPPYVPRLTESDLVMDDPVKVAAYTRAGRIDGVMSPVYLFHCLNICEMIRVGDTVIDLACGPATQLAQVAALNPRVSFTGIDLSEPMLSRARQHIDELRLDNVTFRTGSITHLEGIADSSVDVIMSTMALHHLPDVNSLSQTFRECARVLKPGGGVYLADFGHLRTKHSIQYFGNQYADRQPELFTFDYLQSLNAAFFPKDFEKAADVLKNSCRLYKTFGFPYMMILKGKPRRTMDSAFAATVAKELAKLSPNFAADFADLKMFFRLGGLRPIWY